MADGRYLECDHRDRTFNRGDLHIQGQGPQREQRGDCLWGNDFSNHLHQSNQRGRHCFPANHLFRRDANGLHQRESCQRAGRHPGVQVAVFRHQLFHRVQRHRLHQFRNLCSGYLDPNHLVQTGGQGNMPQRLDRCGRVECAYGVSLCSARGRHCRFKSNHLLRRIAFTTLCHGALGRQ